MHKNIIEIKGKEQIPFLKRNIQSCQKLIERRKQERELLGDKSRLGCVPLETCTEFIKNNEKSTEQNEWLLKMMIKQLNELQQCPEK